MASSALIKTLVMKLNENIELRAKISSQLTNENMTRLGVCKIHAKSATHLKHQTELVSYNPPGMKTSPVLRWRIYSNTLSDSNEIKSTR